MDQQSVREIATAVAVAEESNEPKIGTKDRLEELCVNTIRFLAVDAVEKAKSGHPGTPMGMADMAFVIWTEFLRHDPSAPHWNNRDRLVLSAGHAPMLIYFYDDNNISIEGETRLAFSEDVKKRFEAYHWHVQSIDGHDRDAVRKSIRKAQKVADRPSIIIARTIIGWGSPKFHGTARAHGEPLGADEVKATKAALGWPQEPTFYVPDEVRAEFARKTKKQARARKTWEKGFEEWRSRNTELATQWDGYWSHALPHGFENELLAAAKSDKPLATRALSGMV